MHTKLRTKAFRDMRAQDAAPVAPYLPGAQRVASDWNGPWTRANPVTGRKSRGRWGKSHSRLLSDAAEAVHIDALASHEQSHEQQLQRTASQLHEQEISQPQPPLPPPLQPPPPHHLPLPQQLLQWSVEQPPPPQQPHWRQMPPPLSQLQERLEQQYQQSKMLLLQQQLQQKQQLKERIDNMKRLKQAVDRHVPSTEVTRRPGTFDARAHE